jgi:hypothetical protein
MSGAFSAVAATGAHLTDDDLVVPVDRQPYPPGGEYKIGARLDGPAAMDGWHRLWRR